MREVEETPGLGPPPNEVDPQRALIARAQQGDQEARAQLVENNLRLVQHILRRFAHRTHLSSRYPVDAEDLFQIGCIGLLKAVDGFDLQRPVRFSTYAVPVIIGEIRRYLRGDQPVKVSRSLRELAQRVEAARDELSQRLGRSPTLTELSAYLQLPREDVAAAQQAWVLPESLDGDGDEQDVRGRPYETVGDADHDLSRVIDSVALRQALEEMDDWERRLVVMRYLEQRPQTEIAAALGVSQAHVSRVERRLLAYLRQRLS